MKRKLKRLLSIIPLLFTFSVMSCGGNEVPETEPEQVVPQVNLLSITITHMPNKTNYELDDQFDVQGLVVTATYSDGTTKDVSSLVQVTADTSSYGDQEGTVSYTENGKTVTADFAFTVIEPKYVVSFNSNGGTGSMNQVADIHGSYTLPQNGFDDNEDYEFAGWKVNNQGQTLQPGATINVESNVTLYAQWNEIIHNYGFDHFDGYYGQLSWSNGQDLKNKLRSIIGENNGTTTFLKYGGNWESNQKADQDLFNHDCVDMVYSDSPILKTNTYNSGSGWQREHAFAASLMTGSNTGVAVSTKGRATDFHNLFASFNSGNSSRGNKNFGVADKKSASYVNAGEYSFDEKNFEPSDHDKGRLARGIFYMGVMYSVNESTASGYQPLTIVEDYVNYSEGNCQYAIGNLSTLVSWNKTSTVDYLEYQHNESVYSDVITVDGNKTQGNRNPFVDYPGLVDYVYGAKQNVAADLSKVKPSDLILGTNKTGTMHYAIENMQYEFSVGETFDSSCYDLVAVDYQLNETVAPKSADLTESYEFTPADLAEGHKEVTIKTAINEIKVDVKVTNESLTDFQYYYQYDQQAASPLSGFSANQVQVADLNGQNWTFTAPNNSVGVSRQTGGLRIGTSTGTANNMTMVSQTSFTDIEEVAIQLNSSAGQVFKATISIGDEVIETFNVSQQDNAPLLIAHLHTPLSGQIIIKFTNLTGSFYFLGVGVNY